MLRVMYTSALWTMERRLRKTNEAVTDRIRSLRQEFERALGPLSSLSANLIGPALLWTTWREERRLLRGKTYEPPTFIERTNWAVEPGS
jgi:hypothetical protein